MGIHSAVQQSAITNIFGGLCYSVFAFHSILSFSPSFISQCSLFFNSQSFHTPSIRAILIHHPPTISSTPSHKMMPLPQIHKFFSGIGTRCRQLLCLKSPPPSRAIEISAPFNFKEGPAIHFPGYSEDDISLMREKALASTAVVEDGRFDYHTKRVVLRSRGGSFSCGLGERMVYHAR